ncbi:16S rRNA methyltransferase [Chryseomicrobium excrementi]|uniref:16S rRNA methyltransferase n=1 Tax=Chryseomicrobium excrementi TaxID=2041346 RepID=A0A2M9EYT5_9BACL|nr:class I SAM-dependent methyltransferase [Chryseomicrobium excrementi]PJK16368.1 16S rRNA methyltransferase [Chryseomicrobium excrementi]
MSNHYYSNRPNVESKPSSISHTGRGHQFTLETDRGVFSKSGVDFGSRVLMEAFQAPQIEGDFADVGCGYGPIGLTLAKDFPGRVVHMVDVNERAVELAGKNASRNGIQNVRIAVSDGMERVPDQLAAVITNPPIRAGKETIFRFYQQAYDRLASGGELWVVIQKKQGAPSTKDFLEELFSEVEVVEKVKGYWILNAKKY